MRIISALLLFFFIFSVKVASSQSIERNALVVGGGNLQSNSVQLTSNLGELVTGFYEAEDNSLYVSSGFLPSLNLETLHLVSFPSQELHVFPNPFQNIIQLKTSLEDYQLRVYDVQGKLVFKSENQNTHTYLLDQLTTGLYILEIQTPNKDVVFKEKIIKK